jgi:predicted RNA-binding protein YlqC (UPF0109 family)
MKEFLHFILAKLVSDEEAISIEETEEMDDVLRFTIKLPEGDYGTVIGKGGKTINAIRSLLNVYQTTHGEHKKIFLNVE